MTAILSGIKSLQTFLWSFPMLFLLMGTHIYFTFRLHFIQRKIPEGIVLSFSGKGQGGRKGSAFSALATALAATIGTGNIIGMSTAIAIGGPGAVFWCWLTGVFGIATCYAECYLSVKYRTRKEDGFFKGGPMYVMERALHQKSAAIVFSFAVILASFGIGSSVQSQSICAAVNQQISVSPKVVGVMTACLAAAVILGGAEQITKVCIWLVPFMSVFYLSGCFILFWLNRSVLPETIKWIMDSAFSFKSVLGGSAGGVMLLGMKTGISRGLFTNEAGLGSVPMAAASAGIDSPEQQSLISMTGPFWDTVVMCAITGIAIVSSMIKQPERFAGVSDEQLCFRAFAGLPAYGSEMLSISLCLFAFATIIGWSYYGECAVKYLGKGHGILLYRIFYIFTVYVGAVISLDHVWMMSDLFNSFMAFPNLMCLWILRKDVIQSVEKEKTERRNQNVSCF